MTRLFGIYFNNKSLVPITIIEKKMEKATKYHTWDISESINGRSFVIGKTSFKQNQIINKNNIIVSLAGNLIYSDLNESIKEEYIFQSYLNKKIKALKYLNGSFSISLLDNNLDTLYLISDRLSSQPIYYYKDDDKIIFSSTIKAILASGFVNPDFNYNVLPSYIQTYERYIIGNETFFKNIYMQPAASILTFSKGNFNIEKYWKPSFHRPQDFNPVDHFNIFKEMFKNSIRECIQDNKNIGFLVSGGLDSRYLAACIKELGIDATAFSFDVKNGLQEKIVKKLMSRLGIKYHFYELNGNFIRNLAKDIVHNGDGSMRLRDCHFIGSLEHIKKNFDIDIMLTGHFGGELFGQVLPKTRFGIIPTDKLTVDLLINLYENKESLTECLTKEILESIEESRIDKVTKYFNEHIMNYAPSELADLYEFEEISRRHVLQLFHFIDWYFDVRRPFMNNDLIDFAINLPYEMRARQTFYQRALNYCFPELSDIISEHGLCPPDSPVWKLGPKMIWEKGLQIMDSMIGRVSIGKSSLYKTKLFSADYRSYAYWLRETENERYIRDLLFDERCLNRGIFKEDFIKKSIEDHMTGKKDNNIWICDLINFELMMKEFFD